MSIVYEVDYKICGEDIQFVEIELDLNESVIVEVGLMMYKLLSIDMDVIFGDGLFKYSGFWGVVVGVGKCILIGESLFMMVYIYQGQGKFYVVFVVFFLGMIILVYLFDVGGELICQKDSFLVVVKGVLVGIVL